MSFTGMVAMTTRYKTHGETAVSDLPQGFQEKTVLTLTFNKSCKSKEATMPPYGRYFRIQSQADKNLYMDVDDLKASSKVLLREYNDLDKSDHQLWFRCPVDHVIRNKGNSSLVLQEAEDQTVIINDFEKGSHSQEFEFEKDFLQRRDNPKMVIAAISMKDRRAGLQVVEFSDREDEKWNLVHMPAAYCMIMNETKALTIASKDCAEGSAVVVQKGRGDQNQKWYEDQFGVIRAKFNDFTFDSDDNDQMVLVDVKTGSEDAKWVAHEETVIINKNNTQQCAEVTTITTANGTVVGTAEYCDTPNQRWKFTYI